MEKKKQKAPEGIFGEFPKKSPHKFLIQISRGILKEIFMKFMNESLMELQKEASP